MSLRRFAGFLALSGLAWGGCSAPQSEPDYDLALTDGRIIVAARAGEPARVIERGSVLIRGDRIVEVREGDASEGSPSPAVRTLDLGGSTVLPGFVDAHTHVLVRAPQAARSDSLLEAFIEEELPGLLQRNLDAGVTTMVSTGDFWPRILDIQAQLRERTLAGPRLHVMGPVFQGPNGHPAGTICELDDWCREHLTVEVGDPATAARRAGELMEQGVIGLKAVYSGGGERISPEAAQVSMDPEVAGAIAEAAAARGLRLAVHENFVDRVYEAVQRGARVLVHTPYEPIAGTPLLDRLVSDRIPMMSTIWVAGPPIRDPDSELWADRLAARKANVRALLDAGGLPVFGTDNFFIDPVDGIRMEIEALTEAGLAPGEIIAMMTSHSAELLGAEAEQGTIEAGRLADLVVVGGNPLDDIAALTEVVLVVLGGDVVVDRPGRPTTAQR